MSEVTKDDVEKAINDARAHYEATEQIVCVLLEMRTQVAGKLDIPPRGAFQILKANAKKRIEERIGPVHFFTHERGVISASPYDGHGNPDEWRLFVKGVNSYETHQTSKQLLEDLEQAVMIAPDVHWEKGT